MPDTIKPGTPTAEHLRRARAEFSGDETAWSHRGLLMTPALTGHTLEEAIQARAAGIEMDEQYRERWTRQLQADIDRSVRVVALSVSDLSTRLDARFVDLSERMISLGREVSHLQIAHTGGVAVTTGSQSPDPATLSTAQRLATWAGVWSPWQVLVGLALLVGGPTVGSQVAGRILDAVLPVQAVQAAPAPRPVPYAPADTAHAPLP